MTHIKRQK